MFTPTRSTRVDSFLTFILFLLISLVVPSWTLAQEKDSEAPVGAVGGAVHADLFTGTATTSIPIEVPPGRQGVQPDLSLVYASGNGNGWVGMGWKLEKSVIERRTKDGLDYAADDYVVRLSGINAELVTINAPTNTEFRAKIEGSFTRILKLPAPDGRPYFEATDKLGKKHRFGYTTASRLADPSDPSRIFRWCLDYVIDVHGNYMEITYALDENQGYLAQINYTGNSTVTPNLAPTNSVIFHLEDGRTDANPMYNRIYTAPNYYKIAKRLKTVEVLANGLLQRAYKLEYTPSAHTGHSQLSSIQQFGSDAVIDGTGTVLSGTSLPAMTFAASPEGDGTFAPAVQTAHGQSANEGWSSKMADVNGDGLIDSCATLLLTGPPHNWSTNCALSNGDGTFAAPVSTSHGQSANTAYRSIMVDVNGDGMADSCATLLLTGPPHNWSTKCALSNGDGTFGAVVSTSHGQSANTAFRSIMVDVNGDGLTDSCATMLLWAGGGWRTNCALGNGDGTFAAPVSTSHGQSANEAYRSIMVDVNGDGMADSCATMLLVAGGGWKTNCALSNGDGTFGSVFATSHGQSANEAYRSIMVDVNGDGLTDSCATMLLVAGGGWKTNCALSNGDGTFGSVFATSHGQSANEAYRSIMVDVNGDGMADSCATMLLVAGGGWKTNCALSNGDGTFAPAVQTAHGQGANEAYQSKMVDVNGDGLTDSCATMLLVAGGGWKTNCALNSGTKPFLLTQISNGLGGTTDIHYVPSTEFRPNHTLLPFPVQVVVGISTDDGNGNISTTNYGYIGGYFHLAEREFRGFNYAASLGPAGPDGEQIFNETLFHQGNDTAPFVNTPSDADGYLRGAPYYTQVSDGAGNIYMSTVLTYTPDDDGAAPFFAPKFSEDVSICDGNASCVVTRTEFIYDPFGNVYAEAFFGDVSDPADDRTKVTSYGYNPTDWLLSFPISSTLYEGIGDTGTKVSQVDFYYDGTTSCAVASTNQVPTKGLLTRSVNWLDGGTSPETRLAYNDLGNLICSRDANGNTTTRAYDSQSVFATSSTNALGHVTTSQYYGVDTTLQDNGLYGQVKQIINPNGATVSNTYDPIGRVLTVTQPDGFTATKSYVGLGTVGVQHVRTDDDLGLSDWSYFDGAGRLIKTESTGADGKIIVTDIEYNVRGVAQRTSLPYFKVGGTPVWATQTYDPMGRVIRTDSPDGTFTLQCYDDWTSASIDANGHKSRQVRNSLGKPFTVHEYEGVFTSCDTALGTPYSTTTYEYDVKGKTRFTTDTLGNEIELRYNTLSQKVFMHDPDMGDWSYVYDAMGNLTQQLDAKGQYTFYQYDALNRLSQKDYGTQKPLGSGDVVYVYDDPASNGIGHLTYVDDSSGSATFYYDIKGQLIRTDKVINSVTYSSQTTYDGLGRVTSSTYPDTSVITNNYNGPQLSSVVEGSTTHISYSGFNAQGQPATATYGNGVVTSYTYNPLDTRLNTLQTVNAISTTLMDLNYTYDPIGNINSIIDSIRGNQTFVYDDLNRLTSNTGPYGPVSYSYDQIGNMILNTRVSGVAYSYNSSGPLSVRPHAVKTAGVNTYNYDANGNMTDGAGRVLTYDFENRPTQITKAGVTTNLVYDGDGGRVMKTVNGVSTIYVGNLYVCEASICSRMIFANGQRIAEVETLSGAPRYYHTDHLGSTGVVTDNLGNNIQDITYYPFGQAYNNTGSADVRYKFTGKELDNSTDLYFYEARYYDAWLGRFISADTVVPGSFDPQALNRYSYVRNNPVIMTDPSGHFFITIIATALATAGAAVSLASTPWVWQVAYQGYTSDWNLASMALQQAVSLATTALTLGGTPAVSDLLAPLATNGAKGLLVKIATGAIMGVAVSATRTALYDLAGKSVNWGKALLDGAKTGALGALRKFGMGRLKDFGMKAWNTIKTSQLANFVKTVGGELAQAGRNIAGIPSAGPETIDLLDEGFSAASEVTESVTSKEFSFEPLLDKGWDVLLPALKTQYDIETGYSFSRPFSISLSFTFNLNSKNFFNSINNSLTVSSGLIAKGLYTDDTSLLKSTFGTYLYVPANYYGGNYEELDR